MSCTGQIEQRLLTNHGLRFRTCPGDGVKPSTYVDWFAHTVCSMYHAHNRCSSIRGGKNRHLMRFRLGCAYISVNNRKAADEAHLVFVMHTTIFVGAVVSLHLSVVRLTMTQRDFSPA